MQDYVPIVGRSTIEELRALAERLSGKVIQNVNSTFTGGGVAEILARMVPLLNQLGVDAQWATIKGDKDFFDVTKKFHNALHGRKEDISPQDFAAFLEVSKKNIEELKFHGDIQFIHDPQPIALIAKKKELGGKWIWRCHIDVSNPDKRVWEFMRNFVTDYDAAVFSAPNFSQELPIRQFLISPSIDPLSDKNKELPSEVIDSVLSKYGLDKDKPIVAQISRFDYLKDPIGVIQAFELVRKSIDCQLVLAGGTATDDPESEKVLEEVRQRASDNPDIHILLIPPESDIEINALQRASTVILQKSIKEGFGLTVTEALWKGKPVVASAVGGIQLQVKNKLTGLLCHSVEGAAYAVKRLLSNKEYALWLGKNAREHVRQNFLITRHLKDYLLLFTSLYYNSDEIYL
ncbi:MAG: glycosyl transferase family 1 [Nitrospirae bacterium CG_4_10_14_3_um_filter_44_29]|nr:glycosyltransferase [Nitrospirota bacterium]PIP70581.1 MAG: glycosyl transferase family 1 [Nitrospirae bacterium CG22_combo_CG10-13_8_21_14_all_44_11]PIV65677.1 MAG: glycosyl transferase family 1 [Nitrospirae bacterium CG01_land_8_20_14_3_00_44_22]PIW88677.1 MAG: glycosyl transferase family 1 [Nitrospirae bacterium CG_4_8_14_3_um_filter_44_28]PIX89800.1 MAG: glycosyl transferase family 1 [Nitrospirae bacterium CG_4_10_14_3_um_filter_44_29]PJA83706.1 MAG: glycosyl transferase family 1 [Nitro